MSVFRRGRFAPRLPVVQQMTEADCGIACLAMALGYHGCHVGLEELRDATQVQRDGTSAAMLIAAARRFGLEGTGVCLGEGDVAALEPGSILHWEFRHFVVFERWRNGHVEIVDPDVGRVRLPIADFTNAFSGVAILFERTPAFRRRRRSHSSLAMLIGRILAERRLLARVMAASLLLPLFALSTPLVTGAVVDRVVPRQDSHLLMMIAVAACVVMLLHYLTVWVRGMLLLHLRTTLDTRLTREFAAHLLDLPFAFFRRRSTGDLLMRLGNVAMIRDILTSSGLSTVLDGVLVVSYLALLVSISPPMAVAIVLLGLLRVSVYLATLARQRELVGLELQKQSAVQGFQAQMLGAIEILKASGAELRVLAEWDRQFVDAMNLTIRRGSLTAAIDALASLLAFASPLLVLLYGALQVVNGDLTLGAMLAMSAIGLGFLGPLYSVVAATSQIVLLGAYADRIVDVLDSPTEQQGRRVSPAPPLEGAVRFDSVSFRYSPSSPLVLRDLSLDVRPGEFVGIVGRSGSGKTTLANLLLGLERPVTGRVLVDGLDLAGLDLRSVRSQLGVVTQNASLLTGSLRHNIAFADETMPFEIIVESARRAEIHDEILAMPMGYDTVIVDEGASLSGGQRQRVALARALARRPPILVLDEATSQLDGPAELAIQHSLAALACTRIVIAHRLSTIIGADRIVVIDDGRIAECGRHDQLMAREGVYVELMAAQTA